MTTEIAGIASLALGAAVATFFAPCAYALLPGYVGYYVAATDAETAPLSGALLRGLAATAGVFVTFGTLSVTAVIAGEALKRALPVVEPLVGIALIVVGLYVLYKGSLSLHVLLPERRASILGFGLFGAAYALAATACVLPLFLAIVLQSLTMPLAETVIVLGTYASTFAVLMFAITVTTAVGREVGASRLAAHSVLLTRIAGAVIVLAGIGQLFIAATYTY